MPEIYSRVASASLKKETTANTAVKPDVFFELLSESLSPDYPYTTSMPIAASRAMNVRTVDNIIPPTEGAIVVNVEPKTFGHFMNGVFGGVASGRLIKATSVGTFTIGETVTGGTSSATGVVIEYGHDFVLVSGGSGTFSVGETITGGTSSQTATVVLYSATTYGHKGKLPKNSLPTYTIQFNYADSAVRYTGVRFSAFDTLNHTDNMITASVSVMAQTQFRHAVVTAITTSGSGTKTITVDQTKGLVATDSVKVFRPSTGLFLDFSAASVKTHTVATVASATSITVTNLETALAVGDLLMLAPQTATYDIGREFTWIGGSTWSIGSALSGIPVSCVENFNVRIAHELEAKHCSSGSNFENLFPSTLLLKGLEAGGQHDKYYEDEVKYSKLRTNTSQAVRFESVGDQIGSTGLFNTLRISFPSVQYDQYSMNLAENDILQEEIPFTAFLQDNTFLVDSLLINTIASY